MASKRLRTQFKCSDCCATAATWAGRCSDCGAWNTMEAATTAPDRATPRIAAVPIAQVPVSRVPACATGVGELDRVLGGGLVPGSVTLLGGEPGIGKSTLVLQVAAAVARAGSRVLYVTAEESAAQVRSRAERLGALHERLYLAAETDVVATVAHMAAVGADLVIVDSIQTVADPETGTTPGSVSQVRGCAQRFVTEARARQAAVVLVGHVTKDGALAGPRVLEHLVDTVLTFEGDRHHALRLLRAVKHRHGATGQLGVFEMTGDGLVDVADPSALFLADRRPGAPGSVVVPILDGGRPLLVEVQALLAPSAIPTPRRQAQGLDQGRLGMILAVLAQRVGLGVADQDVWVTVTGGVRATEPAVDLGVALAVASAATGIALGGDVVACGEVGLAGEIRQVGRIEQRLAEVTRLGFRRVVVPPSAPAPPEGCRAMPAGTLTEALVAAGLTSDTSRPTRGAERRETGAHPPNTRSGLRTAG